MPETTPLIKAALNLRVGAGFDVYKDMQYRIILDNVIMADNSLEYVEERMRIDEMLSYIKLYINR